MSVCNIGEKKLPLLVELSVERTGEDTLPGHYDEDQDVWVVDGPDGLNPIIEMAENMMGLITNTAVKQERDDSSAMLNLEWSTKTEAKPERDDFVGTPMMALLQLFTKTKTHNERDDS